MLRPIGPDAHEVRLMAGGSLRAAGAAGDPFALWLDAALQQAQSPDGPDNDTSTLEQRREQLRAASQQMEAFFLNEMVARMRKSIPEGGLLPKSFATEIYEGMYYEQLSDGMASAGGIGLAEMLYEQLEPYLDGDGT